MIKSPPVMGSKPAIILKRVDLPDPDGPTITKNSPGIIDTVTSLIAASCC